MLTSIIEEQKKMADNINNYINTLERLSDALDDLRDLIRKRNETSKKIQKTKYNISLNSHK